MAFRAMCGMRDIPRKAFAKLMDLLHCVLSSNGLTGRKVSNSVPGYESKNAVKNFHYEHFSFGCQRLFPAGREGTASSLKQICQKNKTDTSSIPARTLIKFFHAGINPIWIKTKF